MDFELPLGGAGRFPYFVAAVLNPPGGLEVSMACIVVSMSSRALRYTG
jgi:hypothetical protein